MKSASWLLLLLTIFCVTRLQAGETFKSESPEIDSVTIHANIPKKYGLIDGYFGQLSYARLSYSSQSPFQSFVGIVNSIKSAKNYELVIGHLIYKNGDQYKGAFNKRNFSGLGSYKPEGKPAAEGIFLDGVLVEPKKLNFEYNFSPSKEVFSKNALPVQNGWEVQLSPPAIAQKKDGKHSGWNTHFALFYGQMTAELQNWSWLKQFVTRAEFPSTPFKSYVARYPEIKLIAETRFEPQKQTKKIGGKEVYQLEPKFEGCALTSTKAGPVFGRYPSGWQITPHGKVFYKIASYPHFNGVSKRPSKEMRTQWGEINTQYRKSTDFKSDSLLPAEINRALDHVHKQAQSNREFCSKEITEDKVDAYVSFVAQERVRMMKIWDEHTRLRMAANKRKAQREQILRQKKRLQKEAAERKRRQAMTQCPVCGGTGHIVTTQEAETRYSPMHTYRNGLKISKTTSITSYQKRYGGKCGRCKGSGLVPK